jgi:hypothetical protein
MPRYDFVSPGAMAGGALQAFLVQRALAERQAMMDKLAAERQKADIGLRSGDLNLRQQQEARIAEAQAQQQKDLEQEREFRRASTISENALPGDPIGDDTRAVLERQGYGGTMRTLPAQPASEGYGVLESLEQPAPGTGVLAKTPPPGILQPAQPERTIARGGSKYLAARTAAEERAAQAAETEAGRNERAQAEEAGRNERAEAQRRLSELIARMHAGNSAETTELRNELLRIQSAMASDKLETTRTERTKAEERAKQASGATVDVIKELADVGPDGKLQLKPGAANLFGVRNPLAEWIPGSETATAKAALERLKSRVALDLIAEMKSQSRTGATGFGAMNERELALLEHGASQLGSSRMSREAALAELQRIYDVAHRTMQGATPTTGGGGGTVRMRAPDGRSLNVPADQVEAAKARGATLAR